jgi:hypothetical protein
MIFVPHRKHTYDLPRPVTFLYVDDFRIAQETRMGLHGLLWGELCFFY